MTKKNKPGQGRKPKPVELHLAQGTYRQDRHGPKNSHPTPQKSRPKFPEHLKDAFGRPARKMWNTTCDHLQSMGILSEVDAMVIEAYVTAYLSYLECLEQRKKYGHILIRHQGTEEIRINGRTVTQHLIEVKRCPVAAEVHKWLAEMVSYAAQLGLTPASRSSVVKNVPNADEPANELLLLLAEHGA